MPKDPEQAVRVLFHIYQQFSKCPRKAYYLHKIFSPELQKLQNSQDIGHYIFQMGKHKGRKDATKLQNAVQQMKPKFSSLRKACSSINCLWTKFYRFTRIAKAKPRNLRENLVRTRLIAFKIIWPVMILHFPCQRQSILENGFLAVVYSMHKKCTTCCHLVLVKSACLLTTNIG